MPSQEEIDKVVKAINQLGRTYQWFHYAEWVAKAKKIGIFCGPKKGREDTSPSFAPDGKTVKSLFEHLTNNVPIGVLHMDFSPQRKRDRFP
jgi:hypothetical protein